MTVIEHIKKRIKMIDGELVENLDRDRALRLKLQKQTYETYLELLLYPKIINLCMKVTNKLDLDKNSSQMKAYGFKTTPDRLMWVLKISEDTSIIIPVASFNGDYEIGAVYLETGYREILKFPDVLLQMIKDGMIE